MRSQAVTQPAANVIFAIRIAGFAPNWLHRIQHGLSEAGGAQASSRLVLALEPGRGLLPGLQHDWGDASSNDEWKRKADAQNLHFPH